jgi:hypothetical protein
VVSFDHPTQKATDSWAMKMTVDVVAAKTTTASRVGRCHVF